MKHIKMFESFESSSYKFEDICEKGEKVIVYQMEDTLAYGIVSIEDALRISQAVSQLQKSLRASGDLGDLEVLDVLRYREFQPGTSYFTLDSTGHFRAYTGTPDPQNFEIITHTDGSGEDGEYNELNAMAFTFRRDHITEYNGSGGINPTYTLNTDSLIQQILRNID
jgi:hypothetical protein